MKPNAKTLAFRDSALAALLGVDSDFGNEQDFGSQFASDFGYEFGDDAPIAATALASPMAAVSALHPAVVQAVQAASARPTASQALGAWQQMNMQQAHSKSRQAILEPNAGSDVKVERYTFSVNENLVLGTASTVDADNNPDTNFRPQQVTFNAPAPGFVYITDIKVANVSGNIGGTNDAYQFNANGQGRHMDLPTLSPANRLTVEGSYSGYVPPGYALNSAYIFCASFTGPATMAA